MARGNLVRLALLALLWGSSFLWIKLAIAGLSPVQLVLARLALGALVLLAVVRSRRLQLPADRPTWLHLTIAALLANAIPYWLFAVGERTVTTGLAGTLNATTPLWAFGIALATRTERRPSALRVVGLITGFMGALLILAPWQTGSTGSLLGALACLAAAASYGVSYVYMGAHLSNRGIPPLVLSAAQLTAATGLLVLATPVAGLHPVKLSTSVVGATLVLGTLGTGAAYVLNYRLIADEGATVASTVTYLLPVVSVTLGIIVLHERVTWRLLAGTMFVLAGVALAQNSSQRKAAGAEQQEVEL
jgi:drug/metabolite transporter (DMT)-like permease